jgi:hypothetical protein
MLRSLLVAGAAAWLAMAGNGPAQPADYPTILEKYRSGEFDAAVRGLSRLPAVERYRGARDLVRSGLRPFRRDVLQAVLALHTELGLGGDLALCDTTSAARGGAIDERVRVLLASGFPLFEYGLVEALKSQFPDDEFLRAWYVTVIAHDDRAFPGRSCYEAAPARIQAHPEMQLALGCLHEKTWLQKEADGWNLPPFKPNLKDAERAFRKALQAAPDLHEARLRLGHVLVLQERPDEALETLGEVRDQLDGGFAYVWRLVEGQAYEARGDFDRAAESYHAARALWPEAQSALMALAQLAYTQGRRPEALELVLHLPGTTTAGAPMQPWAWYAEGADPWSWYYFGTAWRFPTYLARLRDMVREE